MHTNKLIELARRQHGVFARWQALQAGFSHYMIAKRIDSNEWRKVMGSVLAAATTQLDPLGREWAAYLAAGPGAVLSGPSAASRYGFEVPRDQTVWATVPAERHVEVSGLKTLREALPPNDIVEIEGMRVTSAARTVMDCLRVLPQRTAQPLLDHALLRGWLTVDELAIRAVAFAGRRGVAQIRAHLKRVQPGARSEAERLTHAILNGAGVTGWEANYKVRDSTGEVRALLDIAFVEERVAIEIDGLAFHIDPQRFQRDRTRQNWLVNEGWVVLRFTWDDLTQRPKHVLATIRATLARQGAAHR